MKSENFLNLFKTKIYEIQKFQKRSSRSFYSMILISRNSSAEWAFKRKKKAEIYHTWSISSRDSSFAIGAKMFQFSLASSIGWLNDENFEHLKFYSRTFIDAQGKALNCWHYLNKLFSLAAAHSGCEMDRWTFLDCICCNCAGGGSEWGCFVLLSVVVLKLSNEKSLCSDGWYDAAGLKYLQMSKTFKSFPSNYLPSS